VNGNLKPLLNKGLLPRGGNGQTPGSTGGTDNQMSGASFRILIDTQVWDKTLLINSPGQSGDTKSFFIEIYLKSGQMTNTFRLTLPIIIF
jgi:penicillin amidase